MASSRYQSPKLVFPHIAKTAGTSIVLWLQRHYRQEEVLNEASIWRELWNLPEEQRAAKRFVRGHYGSYIAKYFRREDDFRYITILRDPVERTLSHYWHVRRSPDVGPLGRLWRSEGFSLESFLEHPTTRPFASNYQVRNFCYQLDKDYQTDLLAPHLIFPDEVGAAELYRAQGFLANVDLIGFSEEIPRFVDELSQRFGFFPDHDLGRHRSYRDREAIVSPELRKKIHELNELDVALYDWARARYARNGMTYRASSRIPTPVEKITPVNPIDASEADAVHWHVKEPFWGTGWSDVQCSDWVERAPHRWAVETRDPTIVVRLGKGRSYLLSFEIVRFVSERQAKGFSLLIDGEPASLNDPLPIARSDPGAGLFYARIGPCEAEDCELTFHVDALMSFNDVNSEDGDKTPRGFALASLTLLRQG